jgi:hypothetical protein
MAKDADGNEVVEEKKEVKEEKIDYEKLARDEGWRSKEELGEDFDAAKFVNAEEFIKRKPLFETIKQQSKAIKNLQKTVDSVVSFSQKNSEVAVKKAVAELNAKKKEAIHAGDVDAGAEIDKTIDEHKSTLVETKQIAKQEVPEEILEWTAKNKWFDEDVELQDFVTSYAASYSKRNPKESMTTVLAEATKAVKRAFPDNKHFKSNESRREKTAVVETHNDEGGNSEGGSKYSMSKLNEDQRLTYNAYVKKNKIMTHEQFFQKLEEIGALEK